jgi:hypothetical protein
MRMWNGLTWLGTGTSRPVDMATNFQVPQKVENVFISATTISFSKGRCSMELITAYDSSSHHNVASLLWPVSYSSYCHFGRIISPRQLLVDFQNLTFHDNVDLCTSAEEIFPSVDRSTKLLIKATIKPITTGIIVLRYETFFPPTPVTWSPGTEMRIRWHLCHWQLEPVCLAPLSDLCQSPHSTISYFVYVGSSWVVIMQ